ncbi:hypothetical protein YC2023_034305 [Brassica napus]
MAERSEVKSIYEYRDRDSPKLSSNFLKTTPIINKSSLLPPTSSLQQKDMIKFVYDVIDHQSNSSFLLVSCPSHLNELPCSYLSKSGKLEKLLIYGRSHGSDQRKQQSKNLKNKSGTR